MEPWALSDLFVYIVVGLFYTLWNYGPVQVLLLAAGALPFFSVELPLKVFLNYYTKSYEARLPYSRRHSALEFYCVEGTRWLLQHLNGGVIGCQVFFGRRMCLFMYNLRRFRYGIEETGDSYIDPVHNDLFGGYWVKSRSRGDYGAHDLVIYYSPGNMMGFCTSYAYVEYLTLLLMALIEQGFSNPAIFCIETDWAQGYTLQLHNVSMGYEYVCTQCQTSSLVVSGDGPGATALLAMLLHRANPLKGLVPMASANQRLPESAVLISPLAKLAKVRVTNENDWVSNQLLTKFAVKVIDSEESTRIYTKPGLVYSTEWWEKALPLHGTYILYGEEETCAAEIQQLGANLRQSGKVVVEAEPDHVHAWPIIDVYLGRSKVGRTKGITNITTQIAYMNLWRCSRGE